MATALTVTMPAMTHRGSLTQPSDRREARRRKAAILAMYHRTITNDQ
jgi:hypothetical protein